MNKQLEKIIYKYLQEYKKQVCKKCTYEGTITCQISNKNLGCLLKDTDEKDLCKFLSTRLTTLGRKKHR